MAKETDDISAALDVSDPGVTSDMAPVDVTSIVKARVRKPVPSGVQKPASVDTDAHGVRRFKGYVIPEKVQRVRIVDGKGQGKLRKIEDLQPGDEFVLNAAGQPIFIEGQVGVPPKGMNQVLPPATPLQADLLRIKEGHLRADPIIQTVEADPESVDVLNQVLLAIGEEQASLRFDRMEAERTGEDTSVMSMRRVQALKALGDTYLKRKEQIATKVVDLDSPTFRALFEFLCETFSKAMTACGVREEQGDTVMNQFAKMLDEAWKAEAKNRMKK